MTRPSLSLRIAAALAVIFGLATVFSGARALFGGVDMGQVVPFVLWFNFLAGFVYVLAGVGLWLGSARGRWLALALAVATVLVFLLFLWHVWQGGAHEPRTMAAMTLRSGFWVVVAALAAKVGR
jgi:hypothetical protein